MVTSGIIRGYTVLVGMIIVILFSSMLVRKNLTPRGWLGKGIYHGGSYLLNTWIIADLSEIIK